ncbi:MAG: 30S ribosomal protein S2 [Candidatus Eisenbacteria bacterium]|uniref:Small ribosomal subunit protein uS2 n=1 Tax=Eiseniibacteriota bacterium TaxID=2212470 RepID=A0A956NAW2_UNCEI|nr:30S ribosomal protein S2 [Candidatus Eisenbacteria bacterium]MCB9462963.1 30S ribosomal protein S2 [Candidatus Eisenbacteria bacterium]
MSIPTIHELLEAGVHFGHQTRRWNPRMKPYIFIERNGIHILDLQKTLQSIQQARGVIHKVTKAGDSILFVGTKKQAQAVMTEEALRCGNFHVTERWLGGMLTNFQTIKMSIRYLRSLERMRDDGTFEKLSKKEVSRLEKERQKLEKIFSGIKEMNRLPGLMFVVDTRKERIAVAEANRLGIPVLGVVDTNVDPTEITHAMPGNDDAIRSIRLFARFVADSVIEAKAAGTSESRSSSAEQQEAAQPA